ncbi:MAG: glycoside hydrolase 43 family protein [Lachnospiraceae bacterium]|nr:glycoside hydrolase 43 family protein [Lachnospiraceae bacterium]
MTSIHNPVIWADVPDNDVIRVGNSFYMVSTSMHSMPGGPIMHSYDLQHWEIVSYIFDKLADNDGHNLKNGKSVYGKGSWASSLRQAGGYFYCLLNSNDLGHAFMFRTKDIESSGWERYEIPAMLHDPAILVDDDRTYVLYGNGDIRIVEMTQDMLGIKPETDRLFFTGRSENMLLRAEGGHAYKIDGRYYGLYIDWPKDGTFRRRVICYRWDSFDGPIEEKVLLDDDMGFHNRGVAQGAIFDLPDGKGWAAMLFQDHGAVGRIPFVLPVSWADGWPVIGDDGRIPEDFEVDLPDAAQKIAPEASDEERTAIIRDLFQLSGSDNFNHDLNILSSKWQWNHNPDNDLWGFDYRKGYLRLRNGHIADSIVEARNTLTQRTYGPRCSCSTHLELKGLKDGDRAGLTALQGNFGLIGVRAYADGGSIRKKLVMCVNGGEYREKIVAETELTSEDVYLRIDFDFVDSKDTALLYWSIDGMNWQQLGEKLQMRYTLDHFMGYRIGLFSYCTKETGGYTDFEFFNFEVKE